MIKILLETFDTPIWYRGFSLEWFSYYLGYMPGEKCSWRTLIFVFQVLFYESLEKAPIDPRRHNLPSKLY